MASVIIDSSFQKQAIGVVSEYIRILCSYRDVYGDDTLVLMQVGSFYEMYGVDNEQEKIGNVAEIAQLLNIVLTKRNKRIPDNNRKNPLMLGFPCLALSKYIPIILEENYTIVIVNQIKTELSIRRVVTDIISPSTYIDSNNDDSIVLIYIEAVRSASLRRNSFLNIHIGMSAINIMTGKSVVHECYSAPDDTKLPLDDAVSFVQQCRPREIVFSSKDASYLNEDLVSNFGLSQRVKYSTRNVNKVASSVSYQEAVLGSVFENKTMLSNIELLDLERSPFALVSYVLLIEYVYEHNPMLIKRTMLPEIFVPQEHLVLATNTIEQLNILPHSGRNRRTTQARVGEKKDSKEICWFPSGRPRMGWKKSLGRMDNLLSVIDNCLTAMGKRLIRARLLSPISNPDKLEMMYQQIEYYGSLVGDNMVIDRLFRSLADIERLQRKMSMGIISPNELASIHQTYTKIAEIQGALRTIINKGNSSQAKSHKKTDRKVSLGKSCGESSECQELFPIQGPGKSSWLMLSNEDHASIEKFLSTIDSIFKVDALIAHDIDGNNAITSVFRECVSEEIDSLRMKISERMSTIQNIANELSAHLELSHGTVKLEYLPSSGYYLSVTNSRAIKLRKVTQDMQLSYRPGKTATKITSRIIDEASRDLSELTEELRVKTKELYKQIVEKFYSSFKELFSRVTVYISELDVTKSNYKTSILYGYCRPAVCRDDGNLRGTTGSFITASNLRHPIMERIDDGVEYVSNDISIGKEHNGIVLYSMNAGGKTSLLKACGISIILAQMGSFVPASSYSFYPFNSVMSRILSEDNVLKGRSSFVAEMSELRSIMKRADRNTLVLADEITHGTEHTSGSAIFTSSVLTLAERRVNFLFTTHLHNVYPFIKDISNVRVCHLSVEVRDENVVFTRKLTEGPGDSIYGLEVCQSLNMDTEFLAVAFRIRNKIEYNKRNPMLSPLQIKKSRYNKDKLVQLCQICNYSPRCDTDIPLDVHHIKHQCTSDENGMIAGGLFGSNIHKDAKANLVVLCKECHIKVHKGSITIDGYKSTDKGIKLDIIF